MIIVACRKQLLKLDIHETMAHKHIVFAVLEDLIYLKQHVDDI